LKQKLIVFLILLLFFISFFCNKHFRDSKEVTQQKKVIEQSSPEPTVEHKEKLTETVPEKIEIVPPEKKTLATSKELPAIIHKESIEDIPEKTEVVKKEPITEIPRKYSAVAKQIPPKVIKPPLQKTPEAFPEKPAQKKEGIIKIEPIRGTPENRIALLPFDNFSDNPDALTQVMPLIASSLEGKGFNVVSENKIIAFFCEERMRNISFISKEQSRKVGDILHVGTIMVGAVTSYSPEENPRFGISARLIDTSTSRIIWADYAFKMIQNQNTRLRCFRLRI
jgi:TolB-like protein